MTGILNLNKPAGMTSHDVVARVRQILGQKRVGHGGTLDPGASGVLIILVGAATRLAEFAAAEDKQYRFEVIFGLQTDSLDADGKVLRDEPAGAIRPEAIRGILARLTGDVEMVPPMFSAVHHRGERLYELARRGVTVEREPRRVRVDSLRLSEFTPDPSHPRAVFDAICSKGTYVRSLAQMIAEQLGTVACVAELVRTRVGSFRIEEAVSPDELATRAAKDGPAAVLLPADRVVAHLPAVRLGPKQALAVSSGQEGRAAGERELNRGALVRAYVEYGQFFAIAAVVKTGNDELFVAPRKVLRDLRRKKR